MTRDEEESAATYLEAVAAMAKTLAKDIREMRLWEGDLTRRLGAIQEQIESARSMVKNDR